MMLGAPHTYGKVLEMHGSSIKIYAPLLLLVTSDYCHTLRCKYLSCILFFPARKQGKSKRNASDHWIKPGWKHCREGSYRMDRIQRSMYSWLHCNNRISSIEHLDIVFNDWTKFCFCADMRYTLV